MMQLVMFFCKITKQCFLVKGKCPVNNCRFAKLCKKKLYTIQHIIIYDCLVRALYSFAVEFSAQWEVKVQFNVPIYWNACF